MAISGYLMNADPALACALAFLDAGGIDAFLVALESAERF